MPNLTPPKGGAEKKMLHGSHCFTAKNVIKKKKNLKGQVLCLLEFPTGARKVSGFKILGSAYVNKRHTSQKLPENKLELQAFLIDLSSHWSQMWLGSSHQQHAEV